MFLVVGEKMEKKKMMCGLVHLEENLGEKT